MLLQRHGDKSHGMTKAELGETLVQREDDDVVPYVIEQAETSRPARARSGRHPEGGQGDLLVEGVALSAPVPHPPPVQRLDAQPARLEPGRLPVHPPQSGRMPSTMTG